MKFVIVAISTAALIASAPTIFAQGDVQHGSRPRNAGPRLQEGKPGASGYSPGHEMQGKGSKKGSPGASGYARGQTTGSNTKSRY